MAYLNVDVISKFTNCGLKEIKVIKNEKILLQLL